MSVIDRRRQRIWCVTMGPFVALDLSPFMLTAWSDIDLTAKTLTISQARVLVEYKVRIEEPKSRNGARTLPLDDVLVAALIVLRKLQMQESAAAGMVYQAGLSALDWYSDGE
jgi:integrase